MNLLADENINQQIVDRLRQDGHVVWYVVEMDPGISDDVVLDLANREGALLLTGDKDFGELVFRLGRIASALRTAFIIIAAIIIFVQQPRSARQSAKGRSGDRCR